jgi:hypothetical protein
MEMKNEEEEEEWRRRRRSGGGGGIHRTLSRSPGIQD